MENEILDEANYTEVESVPQKGYHNADKAIKRSDAMENEILDEANFTEVESVPQK